MLLLLHGCDEGAVQVEDSRALDLGVDAEAYENADPALHPQDPKDVALRDPAAGDHDDGDGDHGDGDDTVSGSARPTSVGRVVADPEILEHLEHGHEHVLDVVDPNLVAALDRPQFRYRTPTSNGLLRDQQP